MPITMGAFAIGSLSVIGLPVTGGLVSKWYLVMGTAESGQIALLAVFLDQLDPERLLLPADHLQSLLVQA